MFPWRSNRTKEQSVTGSVSPIRKEAGVEKNVGGRVDLDPQWLSRIFTIIPVALILLAGASALWIYFFVLSLLPESRAVINLPALSQDVRVVRDRHGIPGIIGKNENDLAHALGYVMAEDRLWQMDFLRRAATGKLSEIFGEEYLDLDHLTRSVLRLDKKAMEKERGPKEQRRWVAMFVKGINRYISSHYSKLPVEFSLLEYKPAPFTELDVIAITRALAWSGSPALKVDPAFVKIIAKLGKVEAARILPSDPASSAPLIMDVFNGWSPGGYLFERSDHDDPLFALAGLRGGTAWAVAGEKSRSGRTIICWNIQQALSAPRFWYRARLSTRDFSLAGAFIPGVPIAISGANNKVCWGGVTAPIDTADLFLESIESNPSPRAWRIDRWRPMKELTENYKPKGMGLVTRSALYTSIGPVVSDIKDNKAISLKWTGMQGANLLRTFYLMNRAGNGKEVMKAASQLIAPCMSLVWADTDHNYGRVICGRAPLRAPESDGIAPMPAWTGAHDWRGELGLWDLPRQINPATGALAVAQGRPGGPDYPVFLGCYWDVADLAPRIEQMLSKAPDHSQKTFQKIQMDNFSPTAQALKPIVLNALDRESGLSGPEAEALEILRSWDCRMSGDSAGAAAYGLIYESLVRELFHDRLGEDLFQAFTWHSPTVRRAALAALNEPGSGWIDDDSRQSLIARAFKRGVEQGVAGIGSNPGNWRWDIIHTTILRHPLASHSRLWELVYNVGPLRLEGSDDTINYASWSFVDPFKVRAGVTLRQTAQMLSPPDLMAVSPMGGSAHFFSGHYKDQISDWLAGHLHRDPTQISEIRRHGFDAALFKATRASLESGPNKLSKDTPASGPRAGEGITEGPVALDPETGDNSTIR